MTTSSASYPPETGNYTYPFDPTGLAVSNQIVGEIQTLSPGSDSDFFFLIPKAAPFFRESMVIVDQASGLPMDEGIDYVCTHQFVAATQSIGKPIYGSIMFLNRKRTGVLKLTYQTVGGPWTINQQLAMVLLATALSNPVTTTWDEIQYLPYQFPPVNHEFNVTDLKGVDTLVDAINGLSAAVTGTFAKVAGDVLPVKSNNLTASGTIDLKVTDNLVSYVYDLTQPSTVLSIDAPVLNPGQARRIELYLRQLVGNSQVVWPSNIAWAPGTVGNDGGPTLSAAKNAFDVVVLLYPDGGPNWLGWIAS